MFDELKPDDVEHRLEEVIKKYKASGKISVEEIKQRIFESDGDPMEAGNRFQKWWFNCFPKRQIQNLDIDEMNSILQLFSDAWNVFPHRSLEGKSPQDKMREHYGENSDNDLEETEENKMPKMIVGGVEMEFDEFQKMIKKMEKQQKPFKKWIDKTALPEYKKFLEFKFKTRKSIEKHYEVTDIFLERVLHVGFLNYEEIRPEFAVWEFPEWWPTHVLYSDLKPDQVWSSLCDFLWFATIHLKREIPGVWEEASAEPDEHCGLDDVAIPPFSFSEQKKTVKTGRNNPCTCGSGKKYKKCCGS